MVLGLELFAAFSEKKKEKTSQTQANRLVYPFNNEQYNSQRMVLKKSFVERSSRSNSH